MYALYTFYLDQHTVPTFCAHLIECPSKDLEELGLQHAIKEYCDTNHLTADNFSSRLMLITATFVQNTDVPTMQAAGILPPLNEEHDISVSFKGCTSSEMGLVEAANGATIN